MLKRIIFIIYDEGQKEALELLGRKLKLENENILVDIHMLWELSAEAGGQLTEADGGGEGCLFVTDDSRVLKALMEKGARAAAFLHEKNRNQDMSGAAWAVMEAEDLSFAFLEKVYQRLSGLPWTVIHTKRCALREMTVEDVDRFYEIYSVPSITYYMEPLYENPEDEKKYTSEYIRQIYGFYGYGLWSVVLRDSGEVIGRAGLSWREGFDIPELGFVIAVPHQRKGYAFEVCGEILTYGKNTLGFKEIQALIKEGNKASVGLCEKLGFIRCDCVESGGIHYERYLWKI